MFLALVAALRSRRTATWAVPGRNLNAIDFVRRNDRDLGLPADLQPGWIVFAIVPPDQHVRLLFRFQPAAGPDRRPNDVYTLKNYNYPLFGRPSDEEMFNWLHPSVSSRPSWPACP
ncbi:MAG: hypothetical protein H6907_19265 [Hyphomicrobiales bacterium]|nr:hypothetical protein [Hyphomicrobiales bacterium]